MVSSSGSQFPLLYHAHHTLYQEDIPFWLKLAARSGDPILELGCGTGRVLIPLTKAGYQVHGIDHDPEMLAYLKTQLAQSAACCPHLILGDMLSLEKDIDLELAFSLIISPCNTLSTLKDPALQTVLSSAYQFLRPGGLFTASIPNPQVLGSLPKKAAPEVEETIQHPVSGNKVQISSSWQRTPQAFTVRWDYDQFLANGQIERVSAEASHVLRSAHIYLEQLTRVGFKQLETYGDFDETTYEIESPLFVFVAIK